MRALWNIVTSGGIPFLFLLLPTACGIGIRPPSSIALAVTPATFYLGNALTPSEYTVITISNTGFDPLSEFAAQGTALPYLGGTYPGTGGTCGTTIDHGDCTIVAKFDSTTSVDFAGVYTFTYKLLGVAGTMETAANPTVEVKGGTVRFTKALTLGSLYLRSGRVNVVAGGEKTLVTSSFTMDAGATLDLADNNMVLFYTGTSPLTRIAGYITDGMTDGAGGADNTSRPGLKTSVPDYTNGANPYDAATLGSFDTAEYNSLGPAVLMTTVTDRQAPTVALNGTNAILVKFTFFGDSNLDGLVDGVEDYDLYISGFTGSGNSWLWGNYKYSGAVDAVDFSLYQLGFTATANGTL